MRLEALFRPTSIAVVGASDKPTIGRRLIASLDRIGFVGPIFPINPNYSAVSGRQCYANIAELPETPRCRGVLCRPCARPTAMGSTSGISAPGATETIFV